MDPSLEQYGLRVMSGAERGARAAVTRAAMAAVEPFYAAATRARNKLFDAGIARVHRLPRPVLSVGNITTGGTGKTPVVLWLAEALRSTGLRPAILLRGYRSAASGFSDEAAMLERRLNRDRGGAPTVPIMPDPDRLAGGLAVLRDQPDVGVFVLDDAFQHRRLGRDFDLVVIDATNPFGFERVLPRGLLREPLAGLRRANAVLITRADASGADADAVTRRVALHHRSAPVYRCAHDIDATSVTGRRAFAFCAIGNPRSLTSAIAAAGVELVGSRTFADHHAYSATDLASLRRDAAAAGAELLVTTEKDWVKVERLSQPDRGLPIRALPMSIRFFGDDEQKLLSQIRSSLPAMMGPAVRPAGE